MSGPIQPQLPLRPTRPPRRSGRQRSRAPCRNAPPRRSVPRPLRRRTGADIGGACGQLRASRLKEE